MTDTDWDRAALALRLLAIDPFGLGGAVVRMRAGPGRDAVLSTLKASGITAKLPLTISDEQLSGGIDLTRTLAEGRLVHHSPYFSQPRQVLLPMAERCETDLAAKLAIHIDKGQQCCLICLDEGDTPEEQTPPALQDRLAFHIAPEERLPDTFQASSLSKYSGGALKGRGQSPLPPYATVTGPQIEALTRIAAELGIESLRAPLLALNAAKAHARLHGRTEALEEDITAAAALVLAHRATRLPETEDDTSEPGPSEPQQQGSEPDRDTNTDIPDEMLIAAVKAALPAGILALAAQTARQRSRGAGAGLKRINKQRGRPLPSRPGKVGGQNRIDIISTLRAAAPWQKLRCPRGDKVTLYPSDIRIKRYQKRSDRLLIFTVDASGSAAVARLGEAKGAVELLLADAYTSRDHVALVAFRNRGADVLLPPTRSLVQTKRRLAALPGGGGTPLAAGLDHAARLATLARSRGMSPTLVLLTDGRANIALDGTANRTAAQSDAERLAIHLRIQGTPALIIDTGQRQSSPLQALSGTLGAPYIPLPRADASRLQAAVTGALG